MPNDCHFQMTDIRFCWLASSGLSSQSIFKFPLLIARFPSIYKSVQDGPISSSQVHRATILAPQLLPPRDGLLKKQVPSRRADISFDLFVAGRKTGRR